MSNPTIRKMENQVIKGYKAFLRSADGILYTDGFGQGELTEWKKGDRKKIKSELELCENGFHFFKHLCFAINYLSPDNVIYKVIARGDIIKDAFKYCTNDIEIGAIVSEKCICNITTNNRNSGNYNSGDRNSGNYNSGNYNSGNYNSGDRNSGDRNSGDRNSGVYNSGGYNSGVCNSGGYNSGNYNSGNYNSGDCNSGGYNSGDCNSGSYNSGVYNSGVYNSGGYNSGSYNSGSYNSGVYNSGGYNSGSYKNFFCTEKKLFLFDIEVRSIPTKILKLDMSWFSLEKNNTYKKAWEKCPKEIINILKSIPEFNIQKNKSKFKEITGIDL